MTLPGETVGTGAPGPDQDSNVVGPQVMRSNAGYYIGYGCIDPEYGWEEPYSRESGYYRTREDAEQDLFHYTPRDTQFNG